MKAYCISYDLKASGKNYSALFDAIKGYSKWWHYLESTWIVITDKNPNQVWDRLHSTIDKKDSLLIMEVRDNVQGWLAEDAWKWIHENVSR